MIDHSVRPPARVGALAALVVTAVVVILFWSAAGGGQSASAGTSASVSLDAVSDGANTATSVGTIDSCRALASGETAVLDLVIEDVSGLAGFEVDFVYDPAALRVVTLTADVEVDYEFLLSTLTTVIELGDALPDDGSGTFKLAAAQFPSSPVSGSGVLARFKIEAVGSGSTDIALTNVKLSDGIGTPLPPSDTSNVYQGPINGAAIAATPWLVLAGDDDCDGSVTGDASSGETFFGTDPTDACSDTATPYDERGSAFGEPEPAWPFDINDDQVADFGDILPFALHFNKMAPDPDYSARFDFYTDGAVNFGDVLQYAPYFNKDCSDFFDSLP